MNKLFYFAIALALLIRFIAIKDDLNTPEIKIVNTNKEKPIVTPNDASRTDLAKVETSKSPLLKFPKRHIASEDPKEALRILPGGLSVIADHYAVESKSWRPEMGEKIADKNGITFLKGPVRPEGGANVAFDQANDKYYAISSVLKIENVDENLRQQLLDKGLEEHYYQESLKILYVQASNETLFTLQDQLKADKIYAQVEVIRGFHKPR